MSNAHTSQPYRRSWGLQASAKLAVLLVLISSSTGCSLIAVQARPKTADGDAGATALCTSSVWAPILDVAGLIVFAVGAGVGIDNDAHALTALSTGGATIFATSTLYGVSTLGDCDAQPAQPAATAHASAW